MLHKVKFLPRAEKDFFELPETIQDEVLKKTELLAQFPRMGLAMERAYADYRCIFAGRNWYRVVYRMKSPNTVEIAYIRHCRRQIGVRVV